MHNPLRGLVTSEHERDGGYTDHQGRDVGPRDLDAYGDVLRVSAVGRPVYAAFAGWAHNVVRWSVKGNRKHTWAPYKTGNGLKIQNPDGEGQGYNHMMPAGGINDGDWIDKGQLIGHLDTSGNQSAPHLHFETWADWRDWRTAYSPKILFDKYGVSTMDDPTPALMPAATVVSGSTIHHPSEEDVMLFLWGRSRGRILSGGAFRGVPHSVVIAAQKAGVPVIPLDDAGHASLLRDFGDRTQKVALDNEKDG